MAVDAALNRIRGTVRYAGGAVDEYLEVADAGQRIVLLVGPRNVQPRGWQDRGRCIGRAKARRHTQALDRCGRRQIDAHRDVIRDVTRRSQSEENQTKFRYQGPSTGLVAPETGAPRQPPTGGWSKTPCRSIV